MSACLLKFGKGIAEIIVTRYANLSAGITQTLLNSGKPYLPPDIWLNVNFPAVGTTSCSSASDFNFVLSRIYTAIEEITQDDVVTCGNGGR